MAHQASDTRISGPTPARFFGWRGNMINFFRDPIPYMRDAYRTYGNVVAFTEGGNNSLIASIPDCKGTYFAFGPAANQAVLTQPAVFHASSIGTSKLNHPPTNRLLSGIFSMNGEKHREARRLMMPAFHKKRIELYRDDMVAITDSFLKDWQIGAERKLHADFNALTLEIACKTLFGVDVRGSRDNIGRMIEKWIMMNMNPAIFVKVDLPGTPYNRFKQAGVALDNELRQLLDEKRQNGGEENDVLSMMIQMRDENGEPMSEDELIGQANIMFFAAHETTATVMSWTLFLLTQHPAIYKALMEELNSNLNGQPPTVEQLMKLDLLDRVIKESMRILPPIAYLLRIVREDTEIDGQFIPAASELFISPFITHRMPHLYPNPDRFDPDRWLTFNPATYEYIPFGAGVRMCIGATFATMEMKIVLAMILQRYHLSMAPDSRVDYSVRVTTGPRDDISVMLKPVDTPISSTPSTVQGNIRTLVNIP